MIPQVYDEKIVTETISEAEKKAMQGNITLNVVEEPMDHFTTEDDSFLHRLINEKGKGEGYNQVILKDDMKQVVS